MGSLVGLTIGFIGGGFQILRCVAARQALTQGGPGPPRRVGDAVPVYALVRRDLWLLYGDRTVLRTESALPAHDERWRAAYRAAGHRVLLTERA